MKYKVLVVEDEFIVAEDLKNIILKQGHQAVGVADNYKDALVLVAEYSPDLVLIDINLGKQKNGLDLAKILKEKHQTPFVFITSYADQTHINAAKELAPLSYIAKPFNEKNVALAIDIGMSNYQEQQLSLYDKVIQQDFFFIKDKRMMKKVKFEEIQCLQADDNYTFIHTLDNRYIVYISLKEILKKLPKNFIRVHRSYIVNIQFVSGVKADEVYLASDQNIPLGRSFKSNFIEKLNYLSSE